MVDKFEEAYQFLLLSDKVNDDVKYILKQPEFKLENKETIIDLAKLLFICDEIILQDDKIIAKKEILKTPQIDIDKTIDVMLMKIKYNKIDNAILEKIEELKLYPKYKKLYAILKKSIEYSYKIKELSNEEIRNINLNSLERLLNE